MGASQAILPQTSILPNPPKKTLHGTKRSKIGLAEFLFPPPALNRSSLHYEAELRIWGLKPTYSIRRSLRLLWRSCGLNEHKNTQAHTRKHTRTRTHTNTHIHIQPHVRVCATTHTHTQFHTHTQLHTHTPHTSHLTHTNPPSPHPPNSITSQHTQLHLTQHHTTPHHITSPHYTTRRVVCMCLLQIIDLHLEVFGFRSMTRGRGDSGQRLNVTTPELHSGVVDHIDTGKLLGVRSRKSRWSLR